MKQTLREIIRAAVAGRVMPTRRRRRKPPDPSLANPMYRSARPLAQIRAWGGGLKLRPTDVLARGGEGVVQARSALLAAGWARKRG